MALERPKRVQWRTEVSEVIEDTLEQYGLSRAPAAATDVVDNLYHRGWRIVPRDDIGDG